MGIVNGPAPEGRATDWMTTLTMERDSLQVQLQESERLRQDAFQACETMRLERDRLKTVLQEKELQRKRAAELCESMQQQRDELQAQLEAAAVTPAICPQPADEIPGLPDGSMTDFGRVGGYTAEDLAFHESRTQPQPDGTAERLEAVQRMIGHVLGWYTCTDWFDEVERAEAWEQVGALLGRLQREAD